MFEVHETPRRAWSYEVRWDGGRIYCRCNLYHDAVKIATSLNLANHPEETLAKLREEFGYPDGYSA
jgi:hypothetical protein